MTKLYKALNETGTVFAISSLLLCAAAADLASSGTLLALSQHDAPGRAQRTLTVEERVSYQRAIEEVYWRHRIWPKEHPNPKPSLGAVMSQTQIKKKVRDYLRNSQALADYWQRPITTEQLQAEVDRVAQNTRQPEVLQELFEALGNDPFVIAECLARPLLAERLLAHPEFERAKQPSGTFDQTVGDGANYILPTISDLSGGCIENAWTPTNLTGAPDARVSHTAVWTGTEMIIWGGGDLVGGTVNTGGLYNPSTDSWTAISTTNAPDARIFHTAIWTGSEMIVWGGGFFVALNTGGRYDPGTNSWTATSTANAPDARSRHTAIWTGSNMIVWGGRDQNFLEVNTGGRYDPSTDSWTATSTANAPDARTSHTAVWTGSNMIVWGGYDSDLFNSGGRYYPDLDRWVCTSTTGAPSERWLHSVVWTGSEMVVWGGVDRVADTLNTGGRYCVPLGPPPRTPRCRPTPHPRPTPP
jgi:hypothetical protein